MKYIKHTVFPISGQDSLQDLVDVVEGDFWPEIPKVTYLVAGAENEESAKVLMRQYFAKETGKVKGIYWALVGGVAFLGAVAGNMAGTWTDLNLDTNYANAGFAIVGGLGTMMYALLNLPKRVDIILRLAQEFNEGRAIAEPAKD